VIIGSSLILALKYNVTRRDKVDDRRRAVSSRVRCLSPFFFRDGTWRTNPRGFRVQIRSSIVDATQSVDGFQHDRTIPAKCRLRLKRLTRAVACPDEGEPAKVERWRAARSRFYQPIINGDGFAPFQRQNWSATISVRLYLGRVQPSAAITTAIIVDYRRSEYNRVEMQLRSTRTDWTDRRTLRGRTSVAV